MHQICSLAAVDGELWVHSCRLLACQSDSGSLHKICAYVPPRSATAVLSCIGCVFLSWLSSALSTYHRLLSLVFSYDSVIVCLHNFIALSARLSLSSLIVRCAHDVRCSSSY